MVYHYTILCAIIYDYFTIMTLIAIIAIIALFSLLWRVEVRFFWEKQTSGTFRDEQHTEGIMLAKNPSGLITSAGHWHGLVVPGICTLSSNRRAVSAMNVDGMPWIELVPTVDALKAQCYWQPFRAVRFASSRTSTHAVNRFQLAAMFRQWPNRCPLQRNWN